jgi:hypothetical protein
METPSNAPLAPRLEPVLRRLRKRIRRVLASRGALITCVTALAGLLALAGLDLAFAPLPAAVRWLLPFLWLGAVITAVIVAWWRPLRQPLDLVRIARWLETRHEDLDERVSTVLEVAAHANSGMSATLLDKLATEAAGCLDQLDPQLEVSTRRARRWGWPALALLLVWVGLFAKWPEPTARQLVRVLNPTSNLGTAAGRITVTPGSVELIEGDTLEITARHSAGADKALELVLHLPDGSATPMAMETRDDASVYELGRATQGFEYEVRSGREISDRFRVTVLPQPRFNEPRVRLEFPAYTGWAPREQALGDGISALVGTKVELRAKLNTPVAAARLEIDEEPAGACTMDSAADGGAMTARWSLDRAGRSTGRVVLKHRLGREFDAARFLIESSADAPPAVRWLGLTQFDLRLRPDDLLDTGFEITDDVGLGTVELEVQPERGEAARLPVATPPKTGDQEPPVWRGRISQPIGALVSRWPQVGMFKLRMRVEDSRPTELAGPGVGTSEWLTIRVDMGAQSLARQEVFAAHEAVKSTLDQARQLVQQARQRIDQQRNELKNEKVPENARKELAQAREQLAEATEKLEQLATKMEDSVHAAKVDEMREAAATVEKAREQLENAPLQDTAEQREQSAAAARDNAEKAERQLDKLRDEIQRSEPKLQDFAHLKDLEQQQRELARQAEQALAQQPQPEKPAQPWQQQQDQVAEALRQEAQQQPQAQAAALEQQAQEAKALATEAREQAAAQEALKQAAQPADPQAAPPEKSLTQQLAQEQAAIAAEAREQLAEARERQDHATANALPEAVESAEKASQELSQQDTAAAAEAAQQAAEQLAEAAAPSDKSDKSDKSDPSDKSDKSDPSDKSDKSDPSATDPSAADPAAAAALSDLAERQQQVAEALAALDQGKPAEAAAALAEMRAEQTAELAEDIREAPQVNGATGLMQQAAQSSEQAAGQAKQAAQATSGAKPAQAAGNHEQAAKQLQQAAAQLEQAAAEFAQQAAQAAARQPGDNQAPIPGQPLAEAFQQASQAADANTPAAAASHAQAAADALAQAADGTRRALQGQAPGQPGQPGQQPGLPGQQPGQPGQQASEDPQRSPEPDPGVPPELAKLGISAADWEKIKASLKSEVGGTSAIALPEEYRDLVRRYFEQMSKDRKP